MNSDRIKEIQGKTEYPDSQSVQQALMQVWNECAQEARTFQCCNCGKTLEVIEVRCGECVSAHSA